MWKTCFGQWTQKDLKILAERLAEYENQNVNRRLIESQDWSYAQQTLGDKQKNLDQMLSNIFSFRKELENVKLNYVPLRH
jgi:hypothetical protein